MYLTLKGCTGYLGHPLLRQEHRGVHEEQGRGKRHAQDPIGVLGMIAEPTGTDGIRTRSHQC